MASFCTRAVPSLAISPPNMPIRARHSFRPISRPKRSSSKLPLLKPQTSIPMHLGLLLRRFSSSRCPYHESSIQTTNYSLQIPWLNNRRSASQKARRHPQRQARCLWADLEQTEVHCRRPAHACRPLPPSLRCQALPGWIRWPHWQQASCQEVCFTVFREVVSDLKCF